MDIDEPKIKMKHYNIGIETIEVIKQKFSRREYIGFCKGNVLKYITRAGHKTNDPTEDYKKAMWYLEKLIEA